MRCNSSWQARNFEISSSTAEARILPGFVSVALMILQRCGYYQYVGTLVVKKNGVPPVASFFGRRVKDENVRASIRVTLWGRMQQQKLSCSNRVFWSSYDAAHRSSKIHINIHEKSNIKNKPVLFISLVSHPAFGFFLAEHKWCC